MHWARYAAAALLVTSGARVALGQSGTEEIQRLAGCFDVSYSFAEDGSGDLFGGDVVGTREWVGLERQGEQTVLLQHLLFAGDGYFPHWYEVWEWNATTRDWTQQVWGGAPGSDAELRYACQAPWSANRWECHAGRSAKPIRDEDRDYEWLDRTNTILVTPAGWVQNEHNGKMDESGQAVSYELGWIVYERVESAECGAAAEEYPIERAPAR